MLLWKGSSAIKIINNNNNNNSSVIRGRYGVKEKGNEKKEKQIDHKTEGKKKERKKRKMKKEKGGGNNKNKNKRGDKTKKNEVYL